METYFNKKKEELYAQAVEFVERASYDESIDWDKDIEMARKGEGGEAK